MMLRSMTAFSDCETALSGWIFSWEVRSVNHRYLDIALRLPETFHYLEPHVRATLADYLKRGKVDCSLLCKKTAAAATRLQIDRGLIRELLTASQEIEALMVKSAPLSALELIRWPGVLSERAVDRESLERPLLDLLQQALKKLTQARELEGKHIALVIEERCVQMHEQIARMHQLLPDSLKGIRQKIIARMTEISARPDENRLEQELVYLTQKLDISEEIDRLDAHIMEVKRLLNVPEPVGRRLDFLMQEMNREANTLASKAADLALTRAAVEIKVLIEQMREQIQNVE